jgi:hypothetical protein
MGKLCIRRPNDYGGRLRTLRVLIDGTEVAALRPNEEATIELATGPHVLVGAMDWTRSPGLPIDISERQTTVEVSLPFSSVIATFIRPRRAVHARLLS